MNLIYKKPIFKNSTATIVHGIYMSDDLLEQQQLFDNYLSFHENLLKVQVKKMQHLVAVVSFKKLNKIDINKKIKSGHHIITPQHLIIDEKELDDIFDEILPVIKKYYNDSKELKRLEDLNDKRKFSIKVLVEKIVARNEENWQKLATELNVSKNILRKVGEYISAPYLELCAEYFNKKLKKQKWEQPFCPICGSYPSMAIVNDKKDYRILWCRLCDTEWKFKKDTCPFCLTNKLKQIKYIFPPEKSPNRIDACDKCKRYLKTIDEQLIIKKPNLVVENLASYRHDLIALQQGYQIST